MSYADPYGLSAQSDSGFLRREPRSNPSSSNAISKKCDGIHGGKGSKASIELHRQRIPASPDGKLAFDASFAFLPPWVDLACLAQSLTSYRNQRGRRRDASCDLCWPDQRFALEYDSDTFHSDASKLHLDSSRRSTLEKAGVHVVSVTKTRFLTGANCLTLQQ